jgi:hypothetical protein
MFKEGINMKRNLVLGFVVLLLFGFSPFSCFAQSSSGDQRIVGTWIYTDSDGRTSTLVFNANGSGSGTLHWYDPPEFNFTYGISMTGKLGSTNRRLNGQEVFFSPDGRTMILDGRDFKKR